MNHAIPVRRRGHLNGDLALAAPAVLFSIILVIVGTALSPYFFSPINLGNLVVQAAPLILVALGQAMVISSGGIDLSVGGVVAFSAVTTAVMFEPLGVTGAIACGLAAAVIVGVVNGAAVAAGLEPFLVTLGTLTGAQGLALIVSPTPGGVVPDGFAKLATYTGIMPNVLPILLVAAVIVYLLMRRTSIGSHALSLGGDRDVAESNRVPTRRTAVYMYICSALLALAAALFMVARGRTGDPTFGASLPLDSIAAAVLGGVLLSGGRFTAVGAVAGAFGLTLLSNVLNMLGIGAAVQYPVKGALIVCAVLIPTVARSEALVRWWKQHFGGTHVRGPRASGRMKA